MLYEAIFKSVVSRQVVKEGVHAAEIVKSELRFSCHLVYLTTIDCIIEFSQDKLYVVAKDCYLA